MARENRAYSIAICIPDLPNTPIDHSLKDKDNETFLKGMGAALQRTQLLMSLLWAAKDKEDKKEFANLLKIDMEDNEVEDEDEDNEEIDLTAKLGDITPPVPILQMSLDEITTYFAKLIKRLLKEEGV